MAKAKNKTQETAASVEDFLAAIPDATRRADCQTVCDLMREVTGLEPKMWGPSIVGFGFRTVKSPATGREVDWLKIGFSPRKASLSLYVLNNSPEQAGLLEKLGKHKTGRSCLYIKSLDDVHVPTLRTLVRQSVKHMKKTVKERAKNK